MLRSISIPAAAGVLCFRVARIRSFSNSSATSFTIGLLLSNQTSYLIACTVNFRDITSPAPVCIWQCQQKGNGWCLKTRALGGNHVPRSRLSPSQQRVNIDPNANTGQTEKQTLAKSIQTYEVENDKCERYILFVCVRVCVCVRGIINIIACLLPDGNCIAEEKGTQTQVEGNRRIHCYGSTGSRIPSRLQESENHKCERYIYCVCVCVCV